MLGRSTFELLMIVRGGFCTNLWTPTCIEMHTVVPGNVNQCRFLEQFLIQKRFSY